MKLARVIGTATATAKDASLVGATLLVCDVTDGAGKVVEPGLVAADTVGAGTGDTVLIATGSAARMASGSAGPLDATIVAVVDHVTISKK